MTVVVQNIWEGTESPLARFIADETDSAVAAYRARPDLIREHSNIEAAISQGGYGRKQLNELIQNAADAVSAEGGRIKVVLTSDALYCANEGEPFTASGYRTLMLSHSSVKRDDKIGRFGLGFKSVIQVCSSPMIFSRSGSIAWSAEKSREQLESLYTGLNNYPLLRIAKPVDPNQESVSDKVLTELMEWSSTIVKLPLDGNYHWLSTEMRNFPPEFLLFSPNITSIEFDDQTSGEASCWKAERHGNRIELTDGKTAETWVVVRAHHKATEVAAVEAGAIAARETIEVSWAIPLTGNYRRKLGRFWNYFPTQHETSLRGIVNAAFKMNEDRHSILEIRYNEEILTKTLPMLVSSVISELRDDVDPSLYLDLLPSRPRESENWADKVINVPIFKAISSVPSLPDRSGTLRHASEIKVQPALDEAQKLTALWNNSVGRDRPWLHESALTRGRETQVLRILSEANQGRASIEEWLEEVVHLGSLSSYETALEIASIVDRSYPEYLVNMRRSRIVLMADGSIEAPIASRIFLPMDADDASANLVSYELFQYGSANKHLRALDIQAQDGSGRLKRIARDLNEDYNDTQLAESLWRVARSFPVPECHSILEERTSPGLIPVRCRDCQWRPLSEVWLAGDLISGKVPGDEHLLLDDQFHANDIALLKLLNIQTSLPAAIMTKSGSFYEMWRDAEASRLSEQTKDEPSPVSKAGLSFASTPTTNGLDRLSTASTRTRARVTVLLLSRAHYSTKVEFTSSYRSAMRIDGPDLWWARQFGALETPLGVVEVKYCTNAIEGVPSDYLPFPGNEEAAALGLQSNPQDVNWNYVFALAETKLSLAKVHELYGAVARLDVRPPKELLIQYGSSSSTRYPVREILLAEDPESFEYLLSVGEPVVRTKHQELNDALVSNWSLRSLKVTFHTEFSTTPVEDIEPIRLKEYYPFLKRATSGIQENVYCISCESIELVKSNSFDKSVRKVEKEWHLEENSFFYLKGKTNKPRLEKVLEAFGVRTAPNVVIQKMAGLRKDAEAEERRRRVSEQKTDAGKVAELVGRDTLRSLVPSGVKELLHHRGLKLTDQRMFDIVSTLHGTSLLRVLKPALEEAGIETPDHFRGSRSAQEFVRELGFSLELAGVATKKKPEREEVIGPVQLSPLHDYQESTSRKIREMLEGRSRNTRGLVQLPTGAGKTRVAVESIVRDVATKEGNQLVIWIAQSEELCEQAIDTWSYVWQAAGAAGERMAVSRLWGGNSAVAEETKLHLVVATIQTLASIEVSRRQMYTWMSDPDLVVIDEAHGATATSYTPVLSWFGRSFTNKTRLLLGLSATPYRGTNEAETERLATRFGRNLIEPDEFSSADAHEYLQDLGVLARVQHEELAGINLRLLDVRSARDEKAQTSMLEARLDLRQVAESSVRNEAIIDHIKSRQDHGPTLVFAASVEHAEALAAVLSVEGIPSAAISGKTDLGHRRTIIEEFRNERIRVLTNFDVLTQGFDAPRVDAVYVCRPTFSPNKYIQMIGRGLRGPKNGGSSEVLIVNVKDNLEQYGDVLAFTKFDYLWNREPANAE